MKVNSTWFHLGVKDPLSDSRRKHNPLGVVSEREKRKPCKLKYAELPAVMTPCE